MSIKLQKLINTKRSYREIDYSGDIWETIYSGPSTLYTCPYVYIDN